MVADIDTAALIDRLQAFALADAPGSLTDAQAAAALALLDRIVPDLHQLITSGSVALSKTGASKPEEG